MEYTDPPRPGFWGGKCPSSPPWPPTLMAAGALLQARDLRRLYQHSDIRALSGCVSNKGKVGVVRVTCSLFTYIHTHTRTHPHRGVRRGDPNPSALLLILRQGKLTVIGIIQRHTISSVLRPKMRPHIHIGPVAVGWNGPPKAAYYTSTVHGT